VPPEPLNEQTEQGATNRAAAALKQFQELHTDLARSSSFVAFGIENGLVQSDNKEWRDIACIHAITNVGCDNNQTRSFSVWSDPLPISDETFAYWKSHAYAADGVTILLTIGDTITAQHPESDPKDPHKFLTGGKRDRADFLREAVERAKAHLAGLMKSA